MMKHVSAGARVESEACAPYTFLNDPGVFRHPVKQRGRLC